MMFNINYLGSVSWALGPKKGLEDVLLSLALNTLKKHRAVYLLQCVEKKQYGINLVHHPPQKHAFAGI